MQPHSPTQLELGQALERVPAVLLLMVDDIRF